MLEAILFPSSFFNRKKVDEELQAEYDAAVGCGLYQSVFLFSYDEWVQNNRLLLDAEPQGRVLAAYRGWMMSPAQYGEFYAALAKKGIELITTPEEYTLFHIFPNIYQKFKA
jgi:hypothetical protein